MAEVSIRGISSSTENMTELAGETVTKDGKKFKIVKASGALTNGDIVVYSGTTGYTVATLATASSTLVAGIMGEDVADTKYGLMQIYGVHTAAHVDGGTTADVTGAIIGTSGVAGYAKTVTAVGAVAGVLPAQVATHSETAVVFVKCM